MLRHLTGSSTRPFDDLFRRRNPPSQNQSRRTSEEEERRLQQELHREFIRRYKNSENFKRHYRPEDRRADSNHADSHRRQNNKKDNLRHQYGSSSQQHQQEWTRTVYYNNQHRPTNSLGTRYQSAALNTAAENNLPVPARPPSENHRADIRKTTNLLETFKKISLDEYRTRRELRIKNPEAEIKSHEIRVILPGNEEEDIQVDDDDRPPTPGNGLELVLYNAQEAKKRKQELIKYKTSDDIIDERILDSDYEF